METTKDDATNLPQGLYRLAKEIERLKEVLASVREVSAQRAEEIRQLRAYNDKILGDNGELSRELAALRDKA